MRITSRCGGSHVWTGAPGGGVAPAGISIPVGNCQAAVSAVIAVQTSSGAAGRSTSRLISNARLMARAPSWSRVLVGFGIFGDLGMKRDDEPVRTTTRCVLVVVAGHQSVDELRELGSESRAVLGRREAHLAIDAQRGHGLTSRPGSANQLAHL